jgi:hypothetical protein
MNSTRGTAYGYFSYEVHIWDIRGCIQKFPDWPPGTRTANDTGLCHEMQLYRYFVSQSSEFFRHNPLCCFSTSVYWCIFRYRLSPETFGYTLVQAPCVCRIRCFSGLLRHVVWWLDTDVSDDKISRPHLGLQPTKNEVSALRETENKPFPPSCYFHFCENERIKLRFWVDTVKCCFRIPTFRRAAPSSGWRFMYMCVCARL